MDVARPAMIVSFFLVAVTLWYTGQWGGKDPRLAEAVAERPAVVADSERALAQR